MAVAATPMQIARNGRIAAFLREQLAARGMSVTDLAEAMGASRSSCTFVRSWVTGQTAPAPKYRGRLAKLFGVKAETFDYRRGVDPGQALVVAAGRQPVVVAGPAVRIAELLSVSFLANGTTRFRMDATVPTEQAMPILRILMDAGVVAARSGDTGDG